MTAQIRSAAVLGAGVMGAQIAAHLANAGIPCALMDLRADMAEEGFSRAKGFRPNPLFSPEIERRISFGNFENDLPRLKEADWIIEAVVENLQAKRDLFGKIAPHLHDSAVLSTNTSGIPISLMTPALSPDLRKRFMGTHFFNPPRYMKLLEIIPTADTEPEIFRMISGFGRRVLGKGIVTAKDTPNFIANRIGAFAACFAAYYASQNGFSIEEVDALTGPLTGHPKTGTYRTIDMAGLDVFLHVADSLYEAEQDEQMRHFFKVPEPFRVMASNRFLGEKTGQGFYKVVPRDSGEKEIQVLDFSSMDYRPRLRLNLGSFEMAKAVESMNDRLKILLASRDPWGNFFWKSTAAVLAYASAKIPEISDYPQDVDKAMKWGYNWEFGPFELWDLLIDHLGFEKSIRFVGKAGFEVPDWVMQIPAKRFYERKEEKLWVYVPGEKKSCEIPAHPDEIPLWLIKQNASRIVKQNPGASLIDLGDGILCLEFHSKMNAIGEDILTLAHQALDLLERRYEGMIIGGESGDFSAGANLMMIHMLAQDGEWNELDRAVRLFQKMNMRIKYSEKPVVAAPFGRTLGGGCEMVLHSAHACAHAETYMGLVELSAGLIPAGGGVKEMIFRAMLEKHAELAAKNLARVFENVARSRVSSSALEARSLGYLRESDPVVMNRDTLLSRAKEEALSLSKNGYKPPAPRKILVLGESFNHLLTAKIDEAAANKSISEDDAFFAKRLAVVISGGKIASPQEVTEEYLLDLERGSFLSLCRERRSQERMRFILQKRKGG